MGRLLFTPLSVRLGLDASYHIIDRRYVDIESHTDIVIKPRSFAGDFVWCTIASLSSTLKLEQSIKSIECRISDQLFK